MWDSSFLLIWMKFVHDNSPIEPYPEPGSLFWNPKLTQLGPRYLQILTDFHMRSDVGFWAWLVTSADPCACKRSRETLLNLTRLGKVFPWPTSRAFISRGWNGIQAWHQAKRTSPWTLERALKPDADTICSKPSSDFSSSHMSGDVELCCLIDFSELCAWTFAHWNLPWTWEPALKPDVDTTCVKSPQDLNQFPYAKWCGTLELYAC